MTFPRLTVKTTPTNADIYVNNEIEGSSNASFIIDHIGEINVRLELPGYKDYIKVFTVREDRTYNITHTFVKEEEEPPEPPPEPPKPTRIIGKVTHAIFNTPLALAKITFLDKSTLSGSNGNYIIEDPAAASGPITCELSGFDTVENFITAPLEGDLTHNFSLGPVEPPPPPEPTWWEKLLEKVKLTDWFPFVVDKAIFRAGYKLLTGIEITDEEYEKQALKILDWILPINILLKLFTGKNLKGESEEFGSADDWLESSILLAAAVFPGPVDDVAARLALKTITKAEATKLTLRLGVKKTVDGLVKAVKLSPETSAKFLSKFPFAIRNAVINGLGRTAYGREAIYILGKTGYFKYIAPGLKGFLAKTGLGPGWWKLIVGTLAGYITFANFLAWVGKEALVETLSFPIWALIEAKDWQGVLDHIDALREAIDDADTAMLFTKPIPVIRDIWKTYIDNAKVQADIYEEIATKGLEEIKVMGTLTITPIPEDSKVSVEGQIPTTGTFSKELPIGTYGWVVSKFNYISKSGTVELPEIGAAFSVELEKEVVPPEELIGEITISVEPSEAEITIAGHPEITEEGTYTLPIGSYTIYFSLEGYKPATKYAEVRADKPASVSATLIKEEEPEPEKAELLITSKPSFADVMIDGKATYQKTPYTAFLDEGTHKIRVELAGYEPEEEEIDIDWGEKDFKEFILNKVPPTKGTLRILSDPPGAHVYIDGKSQFATTPFTITLLAETYKIRLTKDGYLPDEADVIVEAGIEKEHKVELTEKPITQATITITSDPTEADIYIDGKYQYVKTPYTVLLDPGTYIFRIQKNGYYPIEITAEVEEGEVSEIPFVLEEIPVPEIPPEPYIPYEPYYPTYEPVTPYVPSYVTTPIPEIPAYNYDLLYPEIMDIPGVEPVSPPVEKELLINIETTDLMPTKGRIYSIAFLDLTAPGAEVQVAVLDDENVLIDGFLDFFETGLYTKLVGYNVSFDYRYIFTKMMKYRRASKAWKNARLRDVMQIMKQVKEEFVFGFNKPGTLDAWGKMILGKGKYGTQELLLRKYIQHDFDYVRAFQNRQIELTRDLYSLSRFVSAEAFMSSPAPPTSITSETPAVESVETPKPEGQKTCPTCKAFNSLSATICEICGAHI